MLHKAMRKFSIRLGRIFRIKTVRRFTRGEDGVAAIEFGFVVAPFLALLFAIIETALVFFAGQTLETATADASRMLLTGQGVNFSAGDFRNEVCKRVYALFDCQGKAIIDVRTYPTNSAGKVQKPIKDGKIDPAFTPTYQTSSANQIVVVRVMYKWPVFVPLLGLNLSDIGGGEHLLFATAAFRNEPFQ